MKRKAFTLTELLIVIVLIALLALLLGVSFFKARSKSKLARTSTELAQIATSLSQYAEDNGYQYPPDTSRSVPPGLEKYLSGGTWPTGAWPHGVFDYDSWPSPVAATLGQQIYQITYRLCDLNDPIEYCSDPLIFPMFVRNSGIFYCISGPCIPHKDSPTVPGYCVNCKPKAVNYTP